MMNFMQKYDKYSIDRFWWEGSSATRLDSVRFDLWRGHVLFTPYIKYIFLQILGTIVFEQVFCLYDALLYNFFFFFAL